VVKSHFVRFREIQPIKPCCTMYYLKLESTTDAATVGLPVSRREADALLACNQNGQLPDRAIPFVLPTPSVDAIQEN